jgi:hypothetical protein
MCCSVSKRIRTGAACDDNNIDADVNDDPEYWLGHALQTNEAGVKAVVHKASSGFVDGDSEFAAFEPYTKVRWLERVGSGNRIGFTYRFEDRASQFLSMDAVLPVEVVRPLHGVVCV